MKFIAFPKIFFFALALSLFINGSVKSQIVDSTARNIKFSYQTVPAFSRNIDRIKLITYYGLDGAYWTNRTNSNIKNYCDLKFQTVTNFTISQLYDSLNSDLQTANNIYLNGDAKKNINDNNKKDIVYSLCSVRLFTSENESEMNENVKNISRELIAMGYDNFENDFMPFLARMLAEHREIFYQGKRVSTFSSQAYGIVTAMDIINAHKNPEGGLTAGACRDVSEFALRLMRQSFDVYYNEAQHKNYNPDDYIFLQAWTTPLSQHVTVLMIDPANPRNGYDLDWGRIYKRENQEGLETPNNLGTDIRLWKFDKEKNYTIPLMLLKTDKGQLLDKNSLNEDEFKSFNSAFYKTFYSDLRFEKKINEHFYWNASAGKLNDNLYYVLGSVLHNSRKLPIGNYISYYGKTIVQPHYYENSEVQAELIPWKKWRSSQNLSLHTKYIAKFESKDFSLKKNISFQVFSYSQIYLLLNASKFYTDDSIDQAKIYKTGDGNIYTTYGGKLSLKPKSQKINFEFIFQRRNFLAPKEVRLLGPNPFLLIKNARLICSANDFISAISIQLNSTKIKLNTVYEYDILKTQLLQNEISLVHENAKKNNYSLTFGFNRQLAGTNYYWYPQNKSWFQAGYRISKYETEINGFICYVKFNSMQSGISLQKYF